PGSLRGSRGFVFVGGCLAIKIAILNLQDPRLFLILPKCLPTGVRDSLITPRVGCAPCSLRAIRDALDNALAPSRRFARQSTRQMARGAHQNFVWIRVR